MAYDILVRGFADFARLGNVVEQEYISRDPLSGVLDDANKTFHSSYFPILTSGSVGVYVNGSLVSGTADYNTGEITLTDVPQAQPVANYIFTPYTSYQIAQFVIQGFDEMEGRWTRGWQLLDGSGNWADENSANAYIVDANGSDPLCGTVNFSASRVQVNFFMMCCEYRYLATIYRKSARSDYMWRESVRGMTVDKSRIAQNINAAFDDLKEEIETAMQQAQIGYYPGGDQFGGVIVNPVTLGYVGTMEWQQGAKNNDNWALEGFNVAYRSLTFYP